MARTAELSTRHEDLFRTVAGGNYGVSKSFHDAVGGCDESFNRYGGEDTEFGYRAQMRGGLLVPVREAFAWHQAAGRTGGKARRARSACKPPNSRNSSPLRASGEMRPGARLRFPGTWSA